MEILEHRIPFRAGQLVDTGDRRLGIARAVARPARQQRRDQIGDRSADRLVDVELRGGVFLLLQVAHADHQPRATRFALSIVRMRSASLTASSMSPSASEEMKARSSSSLFFGSVRSAER